MEPTLFLRGGYRTRGVALLALVSGLLIFSGCERAERTADAPPAAVTETTSIEVRDADTPAGELSEAMAGEPVSVVGEVVQQCPASGCWFKVESESGETFINLLQSDIRLSKDHVGQRARIKGKVIKQGSDLAVEATEVEFAPSGTDAPQGTFEKRDH